MSSMNMLLVNKHENQTFIRRYKQTKRNLLSKIKSSSFKKIQCEKGNAMAYKKRKEMRTCLRILKKKSI